MRSTTLLLSALLLGSSTTLGCAPGGTQDQERLRDELDDSLSGLDDLLGVDPDERADLFGNLRDDPCALLAELVDDRGEIVPFGYFVGVEGELGLIVARGLVGADVVFDLHHYQMGASYYLGAGLGTPSGSVGVELYAGVARGFEQGVADWDGWFVTTEVTLGLPFLNDTFELGATTFVTGEDRDGSGAIDPSEILLPPAGIYGYAYNVSVAFDLMALLPDPEDLVNVGGQVTEGRWRALPQLTRALYDHFEGSRLYVFGERLSVRLVDGHGGEPCPAGWPGGHDADPAAHDGSGHEQECVVEFGEPGWDHERRTRHMFYALCWLTGQCALPTGYHMAHASLAAALLRDSGTSYRELCPDR